MLQTLALANIIVFRWENERLQWTKDIESTNYNIVSNINLYELTKSNRFSDAPVLNP